MKEGDGLNGILGYAHLVEGNQHPEHLSKVYLDSVKPSNKTVDAVDKKANKKFQGGSKSQQNSKFRSQSRDNKKGCHNCGSKHQPKCCPAFGKECYHCKKKITFLICAEVGNVARAMAKGLNLKIPDSVIKTIMSLSHPKLTMIVNSIATNKSLSEHNSLANTCTILNQ